MQPAEFRVTGLRIPSSERRVAGEDVRPTGDSLITVREMPGKKEGVNLYLCSTGGAVFDVLQRVKELPPELARYTQPGEEEKVLAEFNTLIQFFDAGIIAGQTAVMQGGNNRRAAATDLAKEYVLARLQAHRTHLIVEACKSANGNIRGCCAGHEC
ncbi:hypothetical protein FJZ28_03365 [Candidatus Peregrinibacteria bacterium]|nr:hypothetical protein [Candidatus Peregrinibacteria bacterium]